MRNIEVVHAICDALQKFKPVEGGFRKLIQFVADRPGHDRRYAIDSRKLESELGWKPREAFTTGLRKTVEWYLDNPKWTENVTSGRYQHWIDSNYANREMGNRK